MYGLEFAPDAAAAWYGLYGLVGQTSGRSSAEELSSSSSASSAAAAGEVGLTYHCPTDHRVPLITVSH